jgi:alpha-mannosidase
MDASNSLKILQRLSRRRFLLNGTGALVGANLRPAQTSAALSVQNDSPKRILHIIGHSHIDAAWLWPWPDGADTVLTTFRSALDRMQETPGFCYSHSSAMHYEWTQQADPGMFVEIQSRIQEGRWEVVGGWPVEPDCNIPSTESFARHCLYGKMYCNKELGVDVKIGFNPDSFGHAAGLPTILKHAGYKYYVFMRPQEHEMALPNLFWWEGPDGSRILTYRIYGSYDWLADQLRQSVEHVFPRGSNHGAFFLGVGDHGGAVTKAQLVQIAAMQSDATLPELRWSTLHEFFTSIEESIPAKDIPVIRGDLQHHARGCYSACGEEKFQNRRAEHQLFYTESVAAAASLLGGNDALPNPGMAEAWKRVLFNQFHDILAGTALYSDYEYARDGLGFACQTALESRHADLQRLAKQVNLEDVPEGAIFAYNIHPWKRKALLEFHYDANTTDKQYGSLKASDGSKTALQLRPSDSMTNFYPRFSAWVDLPSCGYKVFTIERGSASSPAEYSHAYSISGQSFGLTSFRAADGTELLAGNIGLVVIEDKSDTWAHDIASFRTKLGRPAFVSSKVVEDGPVTRVTRQTMRWQNSDIILDIAEFTATDALELRFVINWREHEQILKLEIPTRLTSPRIFAKVPGAVIQRKTDGNEEPYQDWVALQGSVAEREYTIALANNQTYSYDCMDGTLRTILVRSAPYARHNPNPVEIGGIQTWQDQGRQERRFWLLGCTGPYQNLALDRRAFDLQSPAEYVMDSRHKGSLPREQSFVAIEPNNVEVLSIKRSEQGNNIIFRVQERSGVPTRAHISCPSLKVDAQISLSPWEIKTISVQADKRSLVHIRDVSIMEI